MIVAGTFGVSVNDNSLPSRRPLLGRLLGYFHYVLAATGDHELYASR